MPKARGRLSRLERADLRVTRAIARHRRKPAVKAAGEASEIGDQPPLRAISAAVLLLGLWRRDATLARVGADMLASHTLATAVKDVVKQTVDRTRPDHAIEKGYRMEKGGSRTHSLSSFPSGHTAGAVAVAEAVAHGFPALAVPARCAAGAVALIQIPRCKHFVSDIAAGAAIGWAAAVSVRAIMRLAEGTGAADQSDARGRPEVK